jgi:hypothetical protein
MSTDNIKLASSLIRNKLPTSIELYSVDTPDNIIENIDSLLAFIYLFPNNKVLVRS